MPDTGEFIAENVVEESITDKNRMLLQELATTYQELLQVISMVHQAHHMHERGPWQVCHMATCRRVHQFITSSMTKEGE
jgi:hypothetical protein